MAAKATRKNPYSHLRPSADYALEWEAVEGAAERTTRATDLLGLTPEDRLALGLSPAEGGVAPPPADDDARVVLSRALR